MKTASTFLQIAALAACFAVHTAAHDPFKVHGIRRALRIIGGPSHQTVTLVEMSATDAPALAVG